MSVQCWIPAYSQQNMQRFVVYHLLSGTVSEHSYLVFLGMVLLKKREMGKFPLVVFIGVEWPPICG